MSENIYILYRKTNTESTGPVHRLFASRSLNNIFTQQNLYDMLSYELDFFESEEDYKENKADYADFFYYFIVKIDIDQLTITIHDDMNLFLRPQQYFIKKTKSQTKTSKIKPIKRVNKDVIFGGRLSDFEKEIMKRNMLLLSRSKILNPDMFSLVKTYSKF